MSVFNRARSVTLEGILDNAWVRIDRERITGVPDRQTTLGGRAVQVTDGQARLVGSGVLAGSTLTLAQAVGRSVRAGLPISAVAAAAATNPARILRQHDRRGAIAPGQVADLVHLDDALNLRAVIVNGRWGEVSAA